MGIGRVDGQAYLLSAGRSPEWESGEGDGGVMGLMTGREGLIAEGSN